MFKYLVSAALLLGVYDTALAEYNSVVLKEKDGTIYRYVLDGCEVSKLGTKIVVAASNAKMQFDIDEVQEYFISEDVVQEPTSIVNTPVISIQYFYDRQLLVVENAIQEICVYTPTGKMMAVTKESTIDFTQYPSGVYVVKIGKQSMQIINK